MVDSEIQQRKAEATGNYEPFKTTPIFDGTASHPQWMG